MNKIPGEIASIISEGHLSLVGIKVQDFIFSAIIVDTPSTASFLAAGNPVNVIFKENEVVIASSFSGQISMQNKLDCVITAIETGKLFSSITLAFGSFKIVSIITAMATKQMNLKAGDRVTAMIKTNEISLSPND